MPLGEATRQQAREIIARYPKARSALLPMLHLVQAEEGCLTADGIALCAEELELTKAEVAAVATFYTMYKRRPVGRWLVSVCTNISCRILGGDEIFTCLSRHLGVGHDETTADGEFTLEHAECLAACDYAPVLTVNYEFFDNVAPDSALDVVRALQAGERPAPTRGEPLVEFREVERQLAGFVPDDAVRAAVDATGPAHPAPPPPDDVRGRVGADPPRQQYGVPGGVTERVLSPADAAASYGDRTPTRDAGAAGLPPTYGAPPGDTDDAPAAGGEG